MKYKKKLYGATKKVRVYLTDDLTVDYRVTVFIPFIEHFLNQLELRLLEHKNFLSNIQNILPKTVVEINEKEINECILGVTQVLEN